MTENPKHYSDEEWQEIFDGETVSEEQIEQEWRHFEDKYMSLSGYGASPPCSSV